MATGTLSPVGKQTFFDNNGIILSLGLVETYAAGTLTPATTWSDVGLMSANANPIQLDSAGRCTIFLDPTASYKYIVKTSAGVTIWTQDNIAAVASTAANTDILGTAGENLTAGAGVFLSDGSGGRTAGRWYMTDSDDTATSTLPAQVGMVQTAITSGSQGSIRQVGQITGLAGLTPGLLYFVSSVAGGLTSTAPANARPIAVADSSTSALLWQSTQVAGTSVAAGLVTNATQTIDGIKTFDDPPLYYPGDQVTNTAQLTGTIYVDAVSKTTTGTSAETLGTFTFPANTFDADGKGFRIRVWGKFAATANNKNPRLQLATHSIIDVTTAANNKTWDISAMVIRSSNTNVYCVATMNVGGSAVDDDTPAVVGSAYQGVIEVLAPAVSWSASTAILRLNVIDSTALGGTTQLGFIVETL